MHTSSDLLTYSEENLLAQLTFAPFTKGYFTIRFYADALHKPSRERTDIVEEFYLYPSGGTLRNKEFHLVWYAAKFDTSHGWVPPGGPWRSEKKEASSKK